MVMTLCTSGGIGAAPGTRVRLLVPLRMFWLSAHKQGQKTHCSWGYDGNDRICNAQATAYTLSTACGFELRTIILASEQKVGSGWGVRRFGLGLAPVITTDS